MIKKEEKEYIVYTYNMFVGFTRDEMTKEEVIKHMENNELSKFEVFRIKDKVKVKKIYEVED